MTVDEVKGLLETCFSPQDWNDMCDKIKNNCGGYYPSFWYKEIIASGFAQKIAERWNGNTNITIETF